MWANQCYTNGACQISSEQLFEYVYIKVANGWPVEIPVEEISQIRSLDDPWNITLDRLWQRKHNYLPNNRPSYWDACESNAYFTPYTNQSPINTIYFQLPNGQEVKIVSNARSVAFTSGEESAVHLMNSADSWVDVMMEDRVASGDPLVWGPWQFENEWRTYGKSGVDPYEGCAWHIKDNYPEWPPQDTETHEYRIFLCKHYTSNDCGEAYQHNADDVDDIYRTSDVGLAEKADTPVKGLWSGLQYVGGPELNEPACDVIQMGFTKSRVERFNGYHRMWIGFGGGDPGWGGSAAESLTYWDAWASADYTYVVDIMADRTLVEVDWGTGISWPTHDDEDVLYDSELDIQKTGFMFLPTSPFDIMGPVGTEEIFRITDEHKENFKQYGFTDNYINWSYATPLVKKPSVIL